MTGFCLNKEDWYFQRDDRTKRVNGISGFEEFSLGVVIDPRIESVLSLQIMAVVSLNILARWCRIIKIEMPMDAISCITNHPGLKISDVIQKIMTEADPYGQFTFGSVEEKDFDQILVIGQTENIFQKTHVSINGSGWLSHIAYGTTSSPFIADDQNPVGPAFAACLGVAEIFRQAIGLPSPAPYLNWYSLFDFKKSENPAHLANPRITSEFDFGCIHQVGCGAVGSSLDFLLSLTQWKAGLYLIDFDQVEFTNCNRSLTFSAYDAAREKTKVDICANILKESKMTPLPFNGTFNQFVGKRKYFDNIPDLILCLANADNVWATIQHNYPPLVLHSTTTSTWGLNFGRHIPKKEWCIMCRFSSEINNQFTPPCGEGIIDQKQNQTETIQGVLPFLSPASAILILAEMAKMQLPDYPINNNFIEFSFKSSNGLFIQSPRAVKLDCVCQEQKLKLYPEKIKNTKFWNK